LPLPFDILDLGTEIVNLALQASSLGFETGPFPAHFFESAAGVVEVLLGGKMARRQGGKGHDDECER
jgi:hypothetical protein